MLRASLNPTRGDPREENRHGRNRGNRTYVRGYGGRSARPGRVRSGSRPVVPLRWRRSGYLHLEKNCATTTNASAGANITGLAGQPFTSASFTLKSAAQCQGGSPRFNIVTTTSTFFLGCNNVTPVMNTDGTATYTFTAATIAAAGNQVPVPTGTITSAEVLIDVQGVADVKNVTVNGIAQNLAQGHHKHGKHGQRQAQG